MEDEQVIISKEELEKLRKKAEIADDALVQLKLSLEDMQHGRISKEENIEEDEVERHVRASLEDLRHCRIRRVA
jgi:hypothetical protein